MLFPYKNFMIIFLEYTFKVFTNTFKIFANTFMPRAIQYNSSSSEEKDAQATLLRMHHMGHTLTNLKRASRIT